MRKKICIITALLMLALFFITGCSQATSTEPKLTLEQILNKSYDNMQAVKSFHFVLDHIGGGTAISMGIEMTKAEGDIVKPDKLKAKISGTALSSAIEVELVTTGGKTMMTNPLSGKWEVPPAQFEVLSVFDPSTGIAAIIKGLKTPSSLDDEKIGDTLCYHLKGSISSDDLKPLIGISAANVPVNVEVWIGKDGFLVKQVKITGKIIDSEKDGIVRTLTFADFNKDINIALPE